MLKHFIAPAAAVLLLVPPAGVSAQTAPESQQPRAQQEQRAEQRQADAVIRADRLIGQAVRDRQDNRVGRIDDLAVNLKENRIAYAVVSHGGVFGIGGEQYAVSWKQIQPMKEQQVVRFDGSEAELQRAQRIDTRRAWPERVTPGERPAEQPVATTGADELRGTVSMSRLIGLDVHNQQGERLGQIDEIALKQDGSLAYAVIAHGGFLGVGHTYVAVPWDRLNINAREERVMLNVTRQQLEGARPFEYRDRLPDRVDWPFGGQ